MGQMNHSLNAFSSSSVDEAEVTFSTHQSDIMDWRTLAIESYSGDTTAQLSVVRLI
jgi:hypothetical protein